MRELIKASRKAIVKGHGSNREVTCPYCEKNCKRTIIPHLKNHHNAKWQIWRKDMLDMYNEGLSSMEIVRECYMLFTWGIVEKEIIKLSEETGIKIAPPLNRIVKKWESEENLQKSSVWKFGRRGAWAVHDGKYRGNWPPQVPYNLIKKYSRKKDLVLDPFVGGGTTVIESWLLGRRSIGVDVSPHAISRTNKRIEEMLEKAPKQKLNILLRPKIFQRDARALTFIKEPVDLICTQPPYLNAIQYTEKNPDDLSHIRNEKEYCLEFKKVASQLYKILKPGRICAVQIGDTRKRGKYIPLGFLVHKELLSVGFETDNIVIKLQYADKSSGFYKNMKDLLIAHEYIFIMKKPSRARKGLGYHREKHGIPPTTRIR